MGRRMERVVSAQIAGSRLEESDPSMAEWPPLPDELGRYAAGRLALRERLRAGLRTLGRAALGAMAYGGQYYGFPIIVIPEEPEQESPQNDAFPDRD